MHEIWSLINANYPYVWLYVIYAMVLLNIAHILRQKLSTATVFAWILMHLLIPVLAVPAYYLLGQNRIRGFVRQRRKSSLQFALSGHHSIDEKDSLTSVQVFDDSTTRIREFTNAYARFGEVFWPTANEVTLLVDGDRTFTEIFASVRAASQYIIVQYYILRADRLGLELKKLLVRKAAAGIPIFLLYDDMGSFWLSRGYIRELREAGVEIARFLPVTNISRFFHINFRNHRKLVIVDGIVAFTGGLNVGEEYIGKGLVGEHWRDTHLKIAGPGVKHLEEIFLDDWYFSAEEPAKKKLTETLEQRKTEAKKTTQAVLMQVIPTGPTDNELIAVYLFMQVIQAARNRLWMATPYFVPNEPIQRLLELAVLRGIDVRILVPGRRGRSPVQWAGMYYLEDLATKGVLVYQYEPGFMHQKVIVVDDDLTVTGTSNLDNRTLYYNFETTLLIHDRGFNDKASAMLADDFGMAVQWSGEKHKSLRNTVRRNFARLAAPLL